MATRRHFAYVYLGLNHSITISPGLGFDQTATPWTGSSETIMKCPTVGEAEWKILIEIVSSCFLTKRYKMVGAPQGICVLKYPT